MAGVSIPLHIQEEIYKLRQAGKTIPEITEKLGVGWKAIKKYGGEVPEDRPKTKAEKAAVKSRTVHSDKTIAKHFKKDIKDVTVGDREAYRRHINIRKSLSETGIKPQVYDKQKTNFRKLIEGIEGKNASKVLSKSKTGITPPLNEVISSKVFIRKYGGLAKSAGLYDIDPNIKNQQSVDAMTRFRDLVRDRFPQTERSGKSSRAYTPSSQLASHVRREYSLMGVRPKAAKILANQYVKGLFPSQMAEFEGLVQYRDMFNRAYRTKKGHIHKPSQIQLHHDWLPLKQGGVTTYSQNIWKPLKQGEHVQTHSSPTMQGIWDVREKLGQKVPPSTRSSNIWGTIRKAMKQLYPPPVGSRSGVGAGAGGGRWRKNLKTGRYEFILM